MSKNNMMRNAKRITAERLGEWINAINDPDVEPLPRPDMAQTMVDNVLAEFGIVCEKIVGETSMDGARVIGHERIIIAARPSTQFRFVANDAATKNYIGREAVLVDVVFHEFDRCVSNTTIFVGPRASMSPASPTVAYYDAGVKPNVKKL